MRQFKIGLLFTLLLLLVAFIFPRPLSVPSSKAVATVVQPHQPIVGLGVNPQAFLTIASVFPASQMRMETPDQFVTNSNMLSVFHLSVDPVRDVKMDGQRRSYGTVLTQRHDMTAQTMRRQQRMIDQRRTPFLRQRAFTLQV